MSTLLSRDREGAVFATGCYGRSVIHRAHKPIGDIPCAPRARPEDAVERPIGQGDIPLIAAPWIASPPIPRAAPRARAGHHIAAYPLRGDPAKTLLFDGYLSRARRAENSHRQACTA